MSSVDKSAVSGMLNPSIPYWYQIAESLRNEVVASGEVGPIRLPTEAQLATRFGVSLITIRQAMTFLEKDEFVSRHRRRGSFAHPQAEWQAPRRIVGLAEPVMIQRSAEETTVLSRKLVPCPVKITTYFPNLSEVFAFERLFRDGGAVIAYAINHVLPVYGSKITEAMARAPMTQVLKKNLGVNIARIQQSFIATLPTPTVATFLQVDVMTPILEFSGVTYDDSSEVVDTVQMFCRADRVQFTYDFELTAKKR